MEIRETEDFICQIFENNVVIQSYKNDSYLIEFPQTLFERPVTELGDYVVSGKSCREIIIPDGIKKIGRYGFYNCRNLEHLSFTSDFMDIGCGAFTGCHNIHRLDIKMNKEESCLKEILLEVPEEMVVFLNGKIEAILWFPEFFEEGVENTPARILMTHVHGSGLYYRNCFSGKRFNFLEYDRRFLMAKAQESSNLLMELVIGRLMKPYGLMDNEKKVYIDFLNENIVSFMQKYISEKNENVILWILENIMIGKDSFLDIIDDASKLNNPVIMSILMAYKKKHFPTKRKSFDL